MSSHNIVLIMTILCSNKCKKCSEFMQLMIQFPDDISVMMCLPLNIPLLVDTRYVVACTIMPRAHTD